MTLAQLRKIKNPRTNLLCLVALALTTCATPGAAVPAQMTPWKTLQDCFRQDVAPSKPLAEQMALTCMSPQAAADPRRSSIERSAAYFNAAAAFNLLAVQGSTTEACESALSCRVKAFRMAERSLLHQDDTQLMSGLNQQAIQGPSLYRLRRALETAQALQGIAELGGDAETCAAPSLCLDMAGKRLATENLTQLATQMEGSFKATACAALDTRASINAERGTGFEASALEDFRSVVKFCPDLAEAASRKLADFALHRAGQLAEAVDKAPPSASAKETAALAAAALAFYQEALPSEQLALDANRGAARMLVHLADLEPAQALAHLDSATAFLEAVGALSVNAPADAKAEDLAQLGSTYLKLAAMLRKTDSVRAETLIARAVRALEEASELSPTHDHVMALADAYLAADQTEKAIATYQADFASSGRLDAALALAGLLEASGRKEEALQTLESSSISNSSDPGLLYQRGRLRFLLTDHKGALKDLSTSAPQLNGPKKAEARYMISISETVLRETGWLARALAAADEAAQLDSFSRKYVRQDCLLHIEQGGKNVRNGTSLQRCPSNGTAERNLLRGMFFLKQAQLTEVSPYNAASQDMWRSLLNLADDAFRAGLETAGDNGTVRFDDLGKDVVLKTALEQGRLVSARCRRDTVIDPDSVTWQQLEAFFGHYGVLKCTPH